MKKKIAKAPKKMTAVKKTAAVKKPHKAVMSVEILSHFKCDGCNGWWSIGDAVLEDRADWFCPWCGMKNTFEKFNNK